MNQHAQHQEDTMQTIGMFVLTVFLAIATYNVLSMPDTHKNHAMDMTVSRNP